MKYSLFAFLGIALVLGAMMVEFNQNAEEVYGESTQVEELYTPKDFWQNIQSWFSGSKKVTDISYDDFTPEEQKLIMAYTNGRPVEEFTREFCQMYGTNEYYEMKASIEDNNPDQDFTALFFFFEQIAATCK